VRGSALEEVPKEVIEELARPSGSVGTVGDYPFLLHSVVMKTPWTGPRTARYACHVWLEFDRKYGRFNASDVQRVTYRLDPSFRPENRIISTTASGNAFELWLSLYGEFTILEEGGPGDSAFSLPRLTGATGRLDHSSGVREHESRVGRPLH
jgi:hypothetical protein